MVVLVGRGLRLGRHSVQQTLHAGELSDRCARTPIDTESQAFG
jgi:hypothetical protein